MTFKIVNKYYKENNHYQKAIRQKVLIRPLTSYFVGDRTKRHGREFLY